MWFHFELSDYLVICGLCPLSGIGLGSALSGVKDFYLTGGDWGLILFNLPGLLTWRGVCLAVACYCEVVYLFTGSEAGR